MEISNSIGGIRTAVTGPKPPRTTLDQSDFLQLMTAQLKNQDPTAPVDNSQYVSQMAQFSQVRGVAETNARLETIVTKLDALIAAQALAARNN